MQGALTCSSAPSISSAPTPCRDSDGVGVLFDVLDRVTDLADVRGIAVKVGRLGCRRRDHAADDQAGR